MYLLDTNALLFYLYNNERLSEKARSVIFSDAPLAVSIVSLWEIAIKASLGKLEIKSSIGKIAQTCGAENIKIIAIKEEYLDIVYNLTWKHKDPFDRLIIATAMEEKFEIISSDSAMVLYEVAVLWE